MSSKKNEKDEDNSVLVLDDELDRELQPHLHPGDHRDHGDQNSGVSLDYINPALEDDNGDESADNKASNNNTSNDISANSNTSQPVGNCLRGSESSTVTSYPVHYSNRTGQSTIVQEPVVIREPNGVHVIRTQQCCVIAPHRHRERPLKIRNIKIIQAFSIVAVVVFFPIGIPAMYYAFKSEKEFHAGILRGNIDMARKLATRAERLIVFSVLGALMVAVVVFAVIERNLMKDDDDYWKNRATGAVYPAG